MFIHAGIHRIRLENAPEHPLAPFKRGLEIFHTYQIAALQTLGANSASWARMGFSTSGAPGSGSRVVRGGERLIVDPVINLAIPDKLPPDSTLLYSMDFHTWEADSKSAAERVRMAFTDGALQILIAAYTANRKGQVDAVERLEEWLKSGGSEALGALIQSAGAVSPGVSAALNLLPLLGLVVDVARSNSSDYIGSNSLVLEIKPTDHDMAEQTIRWRVIGVDGTPTPWVTGAGSQDYMTSVTDGSGRYCVEQQYRFRVIE